MVNLPSKQRTLKELISWTAFAGFLVFVYFANNVIQTRLGEAAFAETGLPTMSLTQATQLAQQENKLILAELSALWCMTCRKFDKDVLSNNAVRKALTEKVVYARIDSESNEAPGFMKRYNAKGYPTFLLLSPNGELVKRIPLTFEPEAFVSALL